MKTAIYRAYGSPDVVVSEDMEIPSPAAKEVLVRVHAAAANPADYHLMSGTYVLRPKTGLRKPKPTRPGLDLAGEVEAVGVDVTRFRVGDAVYGGGRGAFAEYVCVPEDRLAGKPAGLTFAQAAAVPVAGVTALQGLRDRCRIQPGQAVLINGAAGGVGTFAVQIAKWLGGVVTGVCSSRNMDLVRSLGAEHVVDYANEDFTRGQARYDVVFDCVGNRSLWECRRVMTRRATFLAVGVRPGGRRVGPLPYLASLLALSRIVSQDVRFFVASIRSGDLVELKGLIEAGAVTPVIERSYALSEVRTALKHLKAGHVRGKLVIDVVHDCMAAAVGRHA